MAEEVAWVKVVVHAMEAVPVLKHLNIPLRKWLPCNSLSRQQIRVCNANTVVESSMRSHSEDMSPSAPKKQKNRK